MRPSLLRVASPIFFLSAALLLNGVGCKSSSPGEQPAANTAPQPLVPPAPNDNQILSAVQAKLQGEAALDGQNIQPTVANGIVTLNGSAANDASRALAAADSGSIDGVRTVINNLTVGPPAVAVAPKRPVPAARPKRPQIAQRESPPQAPTPPPQPPPQEQVRIVPPPPPPPPAPVAKAVTLTAGTVIPIRLTETLDSGKTQSNSVFHGALAADLIVNGMIAAPRGADVTGRVITAKDAAHFAGSSELSIELTSIRAWNQKITVVTDPYTKQGAARGKNTAIKTGGGAALGAIIGALAGGGRGAAIGAAAGGGLGAGANGVTRGQQVQIPSETLVNFNLQTPVSITTSKSVQGGNNAGQYQSPTQSPNQGPVLYRPKE